MRVLLVAALLVVAASAAAAPLADPGRPLSQPDLSATRAQGIEIALGTMVGDYAAGGMLQLAGWIDWDVGTGTKLGVRVLGGTGAFVNTGGYTDEQGGSYLASPAVWARQVVRADRRLAVALGFTTGLVGGVANGGFQVYAASVINRPRRVSDGMTSNLADRDQLDGYAILDGSLRIGGADGYDSSLQLTAELATTYRDVADDIAIHLTAGGATRIGARSFLVGTVHYTDGIPALALEAGVRVGRALTSVYMPLDDTYGLVALLACGVDWE